MSQNIKIIKKCIELHSDKIIKLYNNIKKLNPHNFILFFLTHNLDLKNYKKIKENNKIIYINNLDDKKYNYCFTFNKTDKYLLFSLKFLYKDKLILDIFNIKSYILSNSINSMYKNSLVFSNVYNIGFAKLELDLINIQKKLAKTLAEIIDIKLLFIQN